MPSFKMNKIKISSRKNLDASLWTEEELRILNASRAWRKITDMDVCEPASQCEHASLHFANDESVETIYFSSGNGSIY